MTKTVRVAGFVAVLLAGLAVAPAFAQNQTASQFYLAYRAAFDKAKSVDELLPYLAKTSADQVKATPVAERGQMFQMMKAMGALTDVKILKEAKSGEGATLTAEGIGPDKKKTTGTIEIVKEGGAWKVGKESWSSGS
jgi:hypothetical protein